MATRQKLWEPAPGRIKRSQMYGFMLRAARRYSFEADWETLRVWSLTHPDLFWSEMLDYAGIEPSAPCRSAMTGSGLLGTTWFDGLKLNYARHMLRFDGDSQNSHYSQNSL